MSEIEEDIIDETTTAKASSLHIESNECGCPECKKGKKHYVQILDMDRYVNALNDWD
jgi:hypothetical protein